MLYGELIVREFIRSIAPRIAYANPTLPFHINRIRDPRSKHLNPKSPDAGAAAWDNGMPPAELIVEIGSSLPSLTHSVKAEVIDGGDTQTININALSSSEILKELLKAAGGPVDLLAGVSNPTLGGEGAGAGENKEGGEKSMAEMLSEGADTTYADIGKAPVVGENLKSE